MSRAWKKPSPVLIALFAVIISQYIGDRILSKDLTRAYRLIVDLRKENDAAYRGMVVLKKENKALHERISRLEQAAHQHPHKNGSHKYSHSDTDESRAPVQ